MRRKVGEKMAGLHGELIAAGYEDVKIVDGGIKALKAAGVEDCQRSSRARNRYR